MQHIAEVLPNVFIRLFDLECLGILISSQESPLLDLTNIGAYHWLREAEFLEMFDKLLISYPVISYVRGRPARVPAG
jgi:hypothetical protein